MRPEPFDRQIEAARGRLEAACPGAALPDAPLAVLAEALVELHGGRMWGKNSLGRGSTFGFSLPVDGPG